MNNLSKLASLLKTHFGFENFRPGQEKALSHLLNGENILVVMPTGSGKSLIYQLAALEKPGLALVISPLIALMKDQVDGLDRLKIPATFINSTIPTIEQNKRLRNLAAGHYRIVYLAPERLRNVNFMNTVSNQIIDLLAIDEAHCISEWGHDFRPDYLRITEARTVLGNPLTVALTATATPQVQDDIIRLLGLPAHTSRVVTGFNRSNLTFQVIYASQPKAKLNALRELLKGLKQGAVIIYTGTRRDAEEIADFACSVVGIPAEYYHAGLEASERNRIQDAFLTGRLSVVVATNAFGMGIDRPDVRLVIHYNIPGSLEAYYQEAGRAGRDGSPARAVLLYSAGDRSLQEWFIENSKTTIEDLNSIYKALKFPKGGQAWLTWQELSRRTAISEVKLKVALADLERAGALERLGDEGSRMLLRLGQWEFSSILAANQRGEQHLAYRKNQLDEMVKYAESNSCRRSMLLSHFGDTDHAEAPFCCDNCAKVPLHSSLPLDVESVNQPAGGVSQPNSTLTEEHRVALAILDCVCRLPRLIGRVKLAQILRGSRANEIFYFGYDKSIYYGRLKAYSQATVDNMIDQLNSLGYLKVIGGKYPVISLTPQGKVAIKEKSQILLRFPSRRLDLSSTMADMKSKNTNEIILYILECVRALPGKLSRSGAAKLLVGSDSERVNEFHQHPLFNRLAGCTRSEVLARVDQLLEEGQLGQNEKGHLIFISSLPSSGEASFRESSLVSIHRIVAIGRAGSAEAVPELVEALENPNGNIRRLAVSALGKIADPCAVEPLIKLLTIESKPQVRQYAVKALGNLKDSQAIGILQSIARDSSEKEYTRAAARSALTKISSKEVDIIAKETEDEIDAFLTHPHPRPILGPWNAGWALSFHSGFTGKEWNRSPIGELAYRLKYQGDLNTLPDLLHYTNNLMTAHPELIHVDAVIPVPPSKPRSTDPVNAFTQALAQRYNLIYLPAVIKTRQTDQQKQFHTLAQKRANVAGAFALKESVRNFRLLLVDDLFDSGATLEEITRLLKTAGASAVYVLTLTRTIHSDA